MLADTLRLQSSSGEVNSLPWHPSIHPPTFQNRSISSLSPSTIMSVVFSSSAVTIFTLNYERFAGRQDKNTQTYNVRNASSDYHGT